MILDPNAFMLSAELFISWKVWCEGKNLKYGSEKSFVDTLKDRGFAKARKDYGRGFKGIAQKGT